MTQSAVERLAQLRAARFSGTIAPPPTLDRPKQRYRPPARPDLRQHVLIRDVDRDTMALLRHAARQQSMSLNDLLLLILDSAIDTYVFAAPHQAADKSGPRRKR